MKALTKKQLIIIGLLLLCVTGYIFILSHKKKLTVAGFAYANDEISIKQSMIILRTIKIDTANIDSNHIVAFSETFSCYDFGKHTNLIIEIDSSGHKLLDTTLVLSKNNKKPLVSFIYPKKTKSKRTFFVGDETDKRIVMPR